MPDPEKTYAAVSGGVALLAAVLIFVPGWAGIDGMDGGYALSFISLWVAISAAVVAAYFALRAARLRRLLDGQGLLARWSYSPVEWQAYAGAEQREQLAENRGLWLFMAGMCLFLGAAFWLIDPEAGLFVLLVMLALTALLAAAAFGLPRLRRQRRLRQQDSQAEAWLGATGVYFDGAFFPWDLWESRLLKVDLQQAASSAPAFLRFHLLHVISFGIQNQVLLVPVPTGRLAEAQALLEQFKTTSRRSSRS